MKTTVLIAVLAAAVFSAAPAMAQQIPPGKGTQAQENAPTAAGFDKQMEQVQENIKKMPDQMDKIRQTQDPQERQKLLQEHWATMPNGMGMMQGMWGPDMMGCCAGGPMMGGRMMGWHGMRDYYSKLTPEQMKQRQYMMDRYMGMQQ